MTACLCSIAVMQSKNTFRWPPKTQGKTLQDRQCQALHIHPPCVRGTCGSRSTSHRSGAERVAQWCPSQPSVPFYKWSEIRTNNISQTLSRRSALIGGQEWFIEHVQILTAMASVFTSSLLSGAVRSTSTGHTRPSTSPRSSSSLTASLVRWIKSISTDSGRSRWTNACWTQTEVKRNSPEKSAIHKYCINDGLLCPNRFSRLHEHTNQYKYNHNTNHIIFWQSKHKNI